jgi:hypothetical protein
MCQNYQIRAPLVLSHVMLANLIEFSQGSHRASLLAGLPDPMRGAGLVGTGRLPARRMERRRDAHHARVHGEHRLAVLGARP